jgi:hypothetical protein
MQNLVPQMLPAVVFNSEELNKVGAILVLILLIYSVVAFLMKRQRRQSERATKATDGIVPGYALRPHTHDTAYLELEPEERNRLTRAVAAMADQNRDAIHGYVDTPAEQIAKGAEQIRDAFYAEGVEWCLGHWPVEEFEFMETVAEALGLPKMAALIAEAQTKYQAMPDPTFDGLASDHPDVVASVAFYEDIETRFDALGGMALVYERADAYLNQHYPWAS